MALDPLDANGFAIAGMLRTFAHHDPGGAIPLHEHALRLNPNQASAWALSGMAFTYLGLQDNAEQQHRRYKELSPLDPFSFLYDANLALILLLKHEHQAALDVARAVTQLNPSFCRSYKVYLAALGHLGLAAEAAHVLRRLLTIQPAFTVQQICWTPMQRQQDREHYAEGLRLAGVPETDTTAQ